MRYFLICLMIFLIPQFSLAAEQREVTSNAFAGQEMIILTGSLTGVYYPAGQAVSDIFKDINVASRVVPTDGSLENLDLLAKGKADLAVVQSDILYLIQNAAPGSDLYKYRPLLRNLYGIASLFPEYTQIMVRRDSKIHHIQHLANRRIYIGKKGSGTRKNAIALLNASGMGGYQGEDFQITSADATTQQALEMLRKGQIDAVFATSGELLVDQHAAHSGLRMLSLDNRMRRKIKAANQEYGFTRITATDDKEYQLMFTRAVLVILTQRGGKIIEPATVQNFTEHFLEKFPVRFARYTPDQNITAFSGEMYARGIPIPLHPSVDKVYLRHGVQVSVSDLLKIAMVPLGVFMLGLFLRLGDNWPVSIFIRNWLRGHLDEKKTDVWAVVERRLEHPATLVLFLGLTIVFMVATGILWHEDIYARSNDTPNYFAEQDLGGLLLWLLTFASTGYTHGLYPDSDWGKTLAVLIPLLGFGGIISGVIWGTSLVRHREARLKRGELVPDAVSKHIIVCGWNDRAPAIIRELTSPKRNEPAFRVVVIAELDGASPLAKYCFRAGFVNYYRGISSSHISLQNARVKKATGALILADHGKVRRQNFRSILTVAALRRYHPNKNKFVITAELHFDENYTSFVEAGVTKLLPLKRVGETLIVHALFNPGVTDLLIDLLSLNGSHSIGKVQVKSHNQVAELQRTNFAQAAMVLRPHDENLLAVRDVKEGGTVPVSELEFQLNSPYQLGVDPLSNANPYKLSNNDELIVISAQQGRELKSDVARHLAEFEGTRTCNAAQELILLVGEEQAYEGILPTIARHCKKVVILSSEATTLTLPRNVTHHVLPSTDRFERWVSGNREDFEGVKRALILAPSVTGDENSEAAVYQDDITLVWAIQLRQGFLQEFNQKIHIVAEMRADDNLELFHDIGIPQPIPVNRMLEIIAGRMVYHRGSVSEFILKLLSYEMKNQRARLEKVAVGCPSLNVELKGLTLFQAQAKLLDSTPPVQFVAVMRASGEFVVFPGTKEQRDKTVLDRGDALFVIRTIQS